MKVLYPRQRQQYIFAAALGAIAVINLLFFLILYAPVRSEYYRLQDSAEKLRLEIRARKLSVERLEKLSTQLETSEQDRTRLFMRHFFPRVTGYSQIILKLNNLVQAAGVRSTRKDYGLDPAPKYGLYSVKIRVPVTGGYSNIANFIKELENSDTFFIINSIDLRGSAPANGAVGVTEIVMALSVETFFYQ